MRIVDDIVFNPAEIVPYLTEASLSEMGLSVVGANWGESAVDATKVRQQFGEQVVDPHPRAKMAVFKLAVRDDDEADLATAAHRLQQLVNYLQQYGGWLRRDFHIGKFAGPLLCRVGREVALGDIGGWQAGESPDVTLQALLAPYGYATEEIESEVFAESEARELIWELPEVLGSGPGLLRVIATNESKSADWRALTSCIESNDLTDGPTSELAYDCAELTLKGGAEKAEREKVAVIRHKALTAGWLTILDSEIAGVGHMTHQGIRRPQMRIWDPGKEAGNVQLRLRWRALGSLQWSDDNPVVPTPLVGNWSLIDLGECRPEPAARGDERWEWQLQARALSDSGAIDLARVRLQPAEQMAVVKSPGDSQAADMQEQKLPGAAENNAGVGTKKWTEPDKVKVDDGNHAFTTIGGKGTATSNYLLALNPAFKLPEDASITGIGVAIKRRKAGTGATVSDSQISLVKGGVVQSGNRSTSAHWSATDAVAIFGGADDLWGLPHLKVAELEEKGFGVAISVDLTDIGLGCNAEIDAITFTVYYTEAADENRVCFATRSIEIASDGVFREHPTDDVWGQVVPEGFLPYAPPSGLELRPVRGILIPSQGDQGELPDSGDVPLSCIVKYRPGYLLAREAAS